MWLETRIAETIARYRMLAAGQRVGVAVSGGADSVCLLHVLRELAPKLGLRLRVLHLNHGLRGEESRADAEFVRELAAKLDLPVEIREADLPGTGNLEQEARRARLAFFRDAIVRGTADRVALGHTRTDQAETVLFRFLRGAGTAGLAGIRPVTSGGLVRPLLEVDRADIEEYLHKHAIPWREDGTNSSPRFARNRIRQSLLPQLSREWNPALVESLAHTAEWARAEEEYWAQELERFSGQLVERAGAVLVPLPLVRQVPLAAARRIVRYAVEAAKGDLRSVDFRHIGAIVGLALRPEGAGRVHLPGVEVRRSFDWLRFSRAGRLPCSYSQIVSPPAVVEVPSAGFSLSLEVLPACGQLIDRKETSERHNYVYNGGMACLDWGRLSGSLQLRNWRPGDHYQPVGSCANQKIKSLFQKARIPQWERAEWPILTDGASVVWARRFGPADWVVPDAAAKTVLQIREVAVG